MSTKPRWPRAQAIEVARELCSRLSPVTERIVVAGSLRRCKPTVGDVEIIYIPRFEDRAVDLFSTAAFNLADEAIDSLLAEGTLCKRPSITGSFSWGKQNKLALHRSGLPVDLFSTTQDAWWNYLVCRTGPADSNTRICMAAQKRGWKWNPYGPGFSRGNDMVPMESEESVFSFVGLPYLPPGQRT